VVPAAPHAHLPESQLPEQHTSSCEQNAAAPRQAHVDVHQPEQQKLLSEQTVPVAAHWQDPPEQTPEQHSALEAHAAWSGVQHAPFGPWGTPQQGSTTTELPGDVQQEPP
jgi:hypothetical protein